jgi:hypothetical protein
MYPPVRQLETRRHDVLREIEALQARVPRAQQRRRPSTPRRLRALLEPSRGR